LPRYKLDIEYDGTPFIGWQMQEDGASVQGLLTAAVAKFSGEMVAVQGAGRTDAGVHALGQVAHVDLARDWATDTVRDAVNAHVGPERIAVLVAERVADEFDARFSAVRRHYLYRLSERRSPLTVDQHRAWRVGVPLDVDSMHAAAEALVGKHDFTTFRSSECQAKSPVKTLDRLAVSRQDAEVHVRASARSFLHNQVRSMVGTLKKVGEGKWPAGAVAAALEARDRARSGPVAPPDGLYLLAVEY